MNKFKELLSSHQPATCPKFKRNKRNLLLSLFSPFSGVLAWSTWMKEPKQWKEVAKLGKPDSTEASRDSSKFGLAPKLLDAYFNRSTMSLFFFSHTALSSVNGSQSLHFQTMVCGKESDPLSLTCCDSLGVYLYIYTHRYTHIYVYKYYISLLQLQPRVSQQFIQIM